MPNLRNVIVILKRENSVLVQRSYSSLYGTFTLHYLYILYELNNWPRNSTSDFAIKCCLFGTVNLIRNAVKCKFLWLRNCSLWRRFMGNGKDFSENVLIFAFDNNSLSHVDNHKNNLIVLVEGLTDDINDSVGTAEKEISINFTKANTFF